MTEEREKSFGGAIDDADEESRGPRAGQRLAEARRARDISIAEIAKELHLDEPKVQALEENQFDVLGAPVFAKGHLRKYAELVGVDIDDVLTDYYMLNRATAAPPVVGPARRPRPQVRLGPWVVGILIVAALAAVAYWLATRPAEPEVVRTPGLLEPYAGTTDTDAPPPVEPREPVQGGRSDVDGAGTSATAAADFVGEPPSEETGTAESIAPATEAAAAGQVMLVMTFSGECWTEVTDADGRRLFFGLGEAGQSVTRSGTPPLQALFGDRYNVSVTVNGKELPITSGGRRGNTARVTIDNP